MIYFITQSDEFVKIGVSNNPEERLAQLQTGNPNKLKIWFCIPGGLDEEVRLHSFFRCVRAEGEWFNLTSGMKQELCNLITVFDGDLEKHYGTNGWIEDSYPFTNDDGTVIHMGNKFAV